MIRVIVKGEDSQKKAISHPLEAIPLPAETFVKEKRYWTFVVCS